MTELLSETTLSETGSPSAAPSPTSQEDAEASQDECVTGPLSDDEGGVTSIRMGAVVVGVVTGVLLLGAGFSYCVFFGGKGQGGNVLIAGRISV